MAKHYVKLNFEYGNDEDGTLIPKNSGSVVWVSMELDEAVVLQNYAIIPAISECITKAGELGTIPVEATGVPKKA